VVARIFHREDTAFCVRCDVLERSHVSGLAPVHSANR
jgi:hypothetical protein